MKGTYFLGVDGGGSKVKAVVTDAAGRILGTSKGPGAVFEGRPQRPQLAILKKLVADACRRARLRLSDITLAGLGLSGIDYDFEVPMQRRVIAKALSLPAKRILLVNDGVAALWGASPEPAVVMLQFGTAFTAAWRGAYGAEQCFDNLAVGRPFDIRDELTGLVARMIDGREKTTPLKRLALKHYGVSEKNYGRLLFQKRISRKRLLTTPPLVFKAWQRGDAGAAKLAKALAKDMALAALTMRKKAGHSKVVTALGGGVLSRGSEGLLKAVARELGAPVIRPALPPELGATVMAAHASGLNVLNYFRSLQ